MMCIRAAILALLLLAPATFAASYNSAVRLPGESFLAAKNRLLAEAASQGQPPPAPDAPILAGAGNVPGEKGGLTYSDAPDYGDEATASAAFRAIRDKRFLFMTGRPDFARRETWLYPDDGCYMRADLVVRLLTGWGYQPPLKIFAMGSLVVQTPYHPSGQVRWVYHVAPLIRAGNSPFVLDPALAGKHPIPATEWLARLVGTTRVVICRPGTYGPSDNCLVPTPVTEARVLADALPFLGYEWSRATALGLFPDRVLGEHPPWDGQ
jgi:hypothetical protein